MRILMLVGALLIAIGVVGLVDGGVSYDKEEKKADLGPIEVRVTQREQIAIHPAIGALVAAAGVVVLVIGIRGRRSASRHEAGGAGTLDSAA